MELEYTVETVCGDVTNTRRLTINDPSELVVERMVDRIMEDRNVQISRGPATA